MIRIPTKTVGWRPILKMIHVSVIQGNADFMVVEAGMMDYRSPALVLPGSGRIKPTLKVGIEGWLCTRRIYPG
jgi:hypothetical protein